MKTKLRLRIIWDATITKVILIVTLVVLLVLAIVLPSILTARPDGSILAFNRDATSGTREAFVEKVLQTDKKTWTPGSNVREVRNNDSMITFVEREKNSVGYVSFGTVAEFDEAGNPILRTDRNGMDHIAFTEYEGVAPTYDAIFSGEYGAARNFNAFFRVVEGSNEYQITNFDWASMTIDDASLEAVNTTGHANDLKAAYLFFNWIQSSTEAYEVIEESGEIPYSPTESNGGTRIDYFNTDDWGSSVVDTFVTTMGIHKDEQILIEIVGSTSATALMTDLTNRFDDEVSEAYGLEEDELKFVVATNGSGDAVSETVPGTDHSYIGMQSKDQSADGFEGWGDYLVDEEYNEKVYASFAKDAILIIYNTSNLSQELKDVIASSESGLLNVEKETLYDLYTYNEYMYYEDLFIEHTEDSEVVL